MRAAIGLCLVLAACGGGGDDGDDGPPNPADPKLIAGGGVADAPLSGTLHVHVVELDSSTPIANATVRVGGATATSAATGLASFTDLSGKQTVTVTAPGHAAATWVGVGGANVTIPLEPSPRVIPTARATGTIAGWSGLPAPAGLNDYNLGVVLYSFLDDPSAPENSIAQGMNGTLPANTCLRTFLGGNACSFQLNARVGKQIHTAAIVAGNTQGTDDPSDDTHTLIGYAATQPMTLAANQQVSNESLAAVTAKVPFYVALPAPPSGLPYIAAIPELSLADGSGRIVFPLPILNRTKTSTEVLAPSGAFAGKYHLVAIATPSGTATTPYSSAFVYEVAGTATVAEWLAPPTQLATGATYSFTAPAGAPFRTAQLSRDKTTPLWNVAVLDGSSSFQLPALSPDPLGSGSVTFSVTAADVPGFDAAKFEIPKVKSTLVRASGAQTTFTR